MVKKIGGGQARFELATNGLIVPSEGVLRQ